MSTALTGRWTYAGAAMQTDGTKLYDFTARVAIEATGADGEVRVILDTDHKESRSVSEPARLRTTPDGTMILLYDYIADPAHPTTASHNFFGMVRYVFAADGQSATGTYLNYNGRYTCGECRLVRA